MVQNHQLLVALRKRTKARDNAAARNATDKNR